MQLHPSSGYVLELSKLRKAIPELNKPNFDAMMDSADTNTDDCMDFLEAVGPPDNETPWPSSVFKLTDEDDSDELKRGVWYAYFEESDIYERSLCLGAIRLDKMIGELPQRREWTTFS